MLGSYRWNAGMGLVGAGLTFIFSIGSNGLPLTAIRCLYAFLAFFLLAYAMRFALGQLLGAGQQPKAEGDALAEALAEEQAVGNRFNQSTPDDKEDLNALLREQMAAAGSGPGVQQAAGERQFQPLKPPKLVSTQDKQPDELVQALRHLAKNGD